MVDRRTFLKSSLLSAGALAFTPSFNNLFAGQNPVLSGPPHRFVFMRKSNGNVPELFVPPTFSDVDKTKDKNKEKLEIALDKHELPDWLKCLDKHKENMTILHGISMNVSGGGHYSYSGCMGVYQAGRNIISLIKRATVDFELAKMFPSPYGHVELSLASSGSGTSFRSGIVPGFSAPAPQQRNYCYADPETAYNELFKSVTNSSAVESENTLLEYLKDKESNRVSKLSGQEKLKVENQVHSLQYVRERNKYVNKLSGIISKNLPKLDKIHADGGPAASLVEKQAAFTEILTTALISGLSNVFMYTIDDLGTPISDLPGNENRIDLHRLGHGKDFALRDLVKASHMKQVETMVDRLKATPEGNGTMFDNTTIIYLPETGAGHHGPSNEAPMIIMSGKNSRLDLAGRYIRLPFHKTEGHQTLGNWYTTILNAYGNPIEHYGDLDVEMVRLKMNQTGAIKQFMRA